MNGNSFIFDSIDLILEADNCEDFFLPIRFKFLRFSEQNTEIRSRLPLFQVSGFFPQRGVLQSDGLFAESGFIDNS